MKIAFFGIHYACNYYHLGGTDSFVRRIARELVQEHADTIDYVLFGRINVGETQIMPGLRMLHFGSYDEAQRVLLNYDHVISIYLPPWERIRFAGFRARCRPSLRFHQVYFSWPDVRIKRELMFADARIAPFNGCVFAISPRQSRYLQKWCARSVLLWPPVPDTYFCTHKNKPRSSRLRVTWIGRLDPAKGVYEVFELFDRLASDPGIELKLCGHRWASCTETAELHQWLLKQERFPYINTEYAGHSSDVERLVREMMQGSDLFVLPYRRLSSTIDTPLLMLEAMAAQCAVVHKPQGDLQAIYGNPRFAIADDFVQRAYELIKGLSADFIRLEQARLFDRSRSLGFGAGAVAERFRRALQGDPVPSIHL